jgi:hypothetical protein
MPLRFRTPTYRQRGTSPADTFVNGFNAGRIELIMGVTFPKYCGVIIDDERLAGLVLTSPPIVLRNDGRWSFSSRSIFSQDFSFAIELPPNPPWRSGQVNGATAGKLAKFIDKKNNQHGADAADFSHVTRVELVPQPNWNTVKQHIERHEMQHAVDFRWIADKLYRPVVLMWDSFAIHGGEVTATNKEILTHFVMGKNEPVAISKYMEGTNIAGRRFHATARGAAPVIEFSGVSHDGLTALFDLSHATDMPPVDFETAPPHAFFKVTSSGVKDQVEASDLGIRCVLELSQQEIDEFEVPNGDDGSGEEELEW